MRRPKAVRPLTVVPYCSVRSDELATTERGSPLALS